MKYLNSTKCEVETHRQECIIAELAFLAHRPRYKKPKRKKLLELLLNKLSITKHYLVESVYLQNGYIKYFLHLALVALTQLYVEATQWLVFIDKEAHSAPEGVLWANIEPEATPYISFL